MPAASYRGPTSDINDDPQQEYFADGIVDDINL